MELKSPNDDFKFKGEKSRKRAGSQAEQRGGKGKRAWKHCFPEEPTKKEA